MRIQLSDHFTYKRLFRFVLPSILMIICTSVYSIVDGFFISNFVGKTPFAAINLIMPILMGVGTIGFMIGTGGSAIVFKAMGEGRKEQANQYFSMLVYIAFVFGVLISIAGFNGRVLLNTVINGSSEMITNLSSSVVSILYNFQFMKFAGENGVAAYGIIMYVNIVFMAIFLGYSLGSAPVISYHYGAGNHAELKKTLSVRLTSKVGDKTPLFSTASLYGKTGFTGAAVIVSVYGAVRGGQKTVESASL